MFKSQVMETRRRTNGGRLFKMMLPHLVVCVIYISGVFIAFQIGNEELFFVLTLPWSMIVTIFSWTIFHTFSDGTAVIDRLCLAGAVVNVMIYLAFCSLFIFARNRLRLRVSEAPARKTGNEILENDLCYYLYLLIRGGGVFGYRLRQGNRDISIAIDHVFGTLVGRSVSRSLSVNKGDNEENEVLFHRDDAGPLRNVSGVAGILVARKS